MQDKIKNQPTKIYLNIGADGECQDFNNRLGQKFITTEGYEIEIIEYNSYSDVGVEFKDELKTKVFNKNYRYVKEGKVKNPFKPIIYNVGYMGQGLHKSKELGKTTKKYSLWKSMLDRCYRDNNPLTYKTAKICEEWHNFQNFGDWFDINFKPEYINSWALDKDILVKGNKVYSPETCCFVPQEINNLFIKNNAKRGEYPIGVFFDKSRKKYITHIGINNKNLYVGAFDTVEEAFQAYKTAKEAYIKEVADKWKDLITEQVYQALINYKVGIDD